MFVVEGPVLDLSVGARGYVKQLTFQGEADLAFGVPESYGFQAGAAVVAGDVFLLNIASVDIGLSAGLEYTFGQPVQDRAGVSRPVSSVKGEGGLVLRKAFGESSFWGPPNWGSTPFR